MKILINLFLILSLFLIGCSEQSSLESMNGPVTSEEANMNKVGHYMPIKVHKVKKAIVIDGNSMDWKHSKKTKLRLEVPLAESHTDNNQDLASDVRMLWDENNLYLFASISDNNINTDSGLLFEKDGFEFYIDGGNFKNVGVLDFPPPNFTPIGYSSNVDFFRFIPGETEALSAYGIIDASTFEVEIVLTKKGYNVEARIPFSSLPDFVGEEGHMFGVEFQTNDNDNGVREKFNKWYSDLDESYFNPSIFGTAVLAK